MLTFSELYLRPEALQEDSARMRIQLTGAFDEHVTGDARDSTRELLIRGAGTKLTEGSYGVYWHEFFENAELRDVLDCLTCADVAIRNSPYNRDSSKWRADVQFAFDRQNMRYRIDDDGVVRLRVDEAFETGRVAALRGLGLPRYGAAKAEFIVAYQALSANNPDGKLAIRGIFEAVEIIFKLSFPQAHRIGAPEIGQFLLPHVQTRYAADRPALESSTRLVNQLKEWVAAAQFYRHGQAQAEPNQPPIEITVVLLGAGTSHLRWLIELAPLKPPA